MMPEKYFCAISWRPELFRPRIIAVLLIKNGALVKSQQFCNYKYIGDPLNAVSLFNAFKADELIFLDIEATRQKRTISTELIQHIAGEANMPFAVGGGLRSLSAIRQVLAAGADKVVLGTTVLDQPEFLKAASSEFGASTIAVCMDVKRTEQGQYSTYYRHDGSAGPPPDEFARRAAKLGAGEIIVHSVERDGMMAGYDFELTRAISAAVSIPVIGLGGAGQLQHLSQLYRECRVSGVAAGSLFVFQGSRRGVLINYPSRQVVREIFYPEVES